VSTISERLFTSFGRKKTDGSVVEVSASSPDANQNTPDLAALRKAVTKGGRGRKLIEKETSAAQDEAKQKALDELFANENWEEISTLYFDLRYAWTGFEYFQLNDKQRRVLAASPRLHHADGRGRRRGR